jgi:hypothetical protein
MFELADIKQVRRLLRSGNANNVLSMNTYILALTEHEIYTRPSQALNGGGEVVREHKTRVTAVLVRMELVDEKGRITLPVKLSGESCYAVGCTREDD